ncbi:MAG TPA: amino acid adenylation domain-containing protein [Streptosporangiaceae bacterium]|jgi:amino acid adenylation domain-containing protein
MLSDSQRAALALQLRRGRKTSPGHANGASEISRRPAGQAGLPLSCAQEQLWFIDRLAPGRATYNIPLAVSLTGLLDAGALGRAVDQLVARHEALRTRLAAGPDGQPAQVIDPPKPSVLEMADLSGVAHGQREARLREFIGTESLRPFSLADQPLLRTWLLRVAPDEHVLLVVVHHAVFDGWSARVTVRELAALYDAEVTGKPPGLAELPVQFADYALWERGRLQGEVLEQLEDYWRRAMAGFETVQFPADRPRPVLEDFDGGLAEHMTSPGLLAGLRELSSREGTTLFVTLMAGLMTLLHRYTGQSDLVVGTASASRTRPELVPLIGFLVNMLPIRADTSGDPSFTELLDRVKKTIIGAYAHQDLPFGKLVETLRVQRDPSRGPVFQIALTYAERESIPVRGADVEFLITDLIVGINAAKFDLDFLAEARPGGLWLECSYKTGLFDSATIRRLLGHFEVLLAGVVADPSARLSQLPVLTVREWRREMAEWNDTSAVFPACCMHQGFEAQVTRTPEGTAAEFGGARVSYAELNRQANQIARRLRGLGVGPEALVGVCMDTSPRRLAALLGIWKAGGGYVPLDPALPAERLSFMMADAAMAVVLADDSTLARLPQTAAATVSLDADWPTISELDPANLADITVGLANVAYVIYTSGSTGRPKGVVIEHRQAVNFVYGMIGHWSVGPSDAVLQFSSLSFDASVQEMFMPLLGGGRVVLAAPETLHSPPRLAALMRETGVTFAVLTPSVLTLLGDEQFPDLRVVEACGEELPSELARRWIRPGLRFANGYGPTETAVTAAFAELDASTPLPPPIGRPPPNCQAYVLDAHLNPVPPGVTGELHIGGAGVARGYLGRPELTRQRFIPDPFTPGRRLYKSGDLAFRRADGSIVFVGRADHQVKIGGLRIELGEIEAALAAHPDVAQAAAVVTGQAGGRQLAAYLRPRPGAVTSPADLRAHLARTLPGYMIPAHLITVDAFPLNTSGKIDRFALPAPGLVPAAGQVAPGTVTESVLVDLYTSVLGARQIGATDSFFDLGGSSLQVMRLIDLINRKTGVDVGVTAIFVHPTPRQLAASIDAIRSGTAAPAGSGPLIELSEGPGQLPLFLIHPVGGTVFGYLPLAGELAGAFRVYGLQAPGLTDASATAPSLGDLADDYAARIRTAWPDGPYRLGGWSMGGVVAFEIARRLEQAGADVSLLVLLDAPFAKPATGAATAEQLAGQFVADAARSLGLDTDRLPGPAASTASEQLAWLAERLADGTGGDDRTGRDEIEARFGVFRAHARMLAGYQPAGPAISARTLIVSADGSPNAPARTRWPQVLSGPTATMRMNSDHYAFLHAPLVTDIGAYILSWHQGIETGGTHD